MKNRLAVIQMILIGSIFMPTFGYADGAAPSPSGVPVIVAAPAAAVAVVAEPGLGDLGQMLLKAIGDWKAVGWQAGLAALIMLLIASMKNSLVRGWLWDKLGWAKVLMAPLLSLIAILIFVKPLTAQAVVLALTTGVGAIGMHEFLDGLKKAPFIKPWMDGVIAFMQKLLKMPPKAEPPKQ